MKPIITILGKPNVGKSSLFNALLGNNESLVANIEGLTRDKQYANLIINHSSYVLVDTGGIGLTNNEIDFAVTKSSLSSFEESDLIIALFDSSTNLSKIDAEILNYIRKASVPFIPVLNKCDLKESENNKDLYYEEGLQNIIEISVTKKQGIRTLEKKIEEIFPSKAEIKEASQSDLRVGIIGKPNAGKSTFFNELLQAERSLVDKSAGTTRDSISHKLDINKAEVILTDTAGIKRKSKLNDQIDNLITRESINTLKNVDGVVFLAAAYWPMSAQDWDHQKCIEMINVNLLGACRILGPVVDRFTRLDFGHIVITGTIAGVRGLPSSIGYTASKAGLMTLAECMQIDLQHTNIKLQLINPGFIHTKASAKNNYKMRDVMTPAVAARKMLKCMAKSGFSYTFPKTIFTSVIRGLQFLPSSFHYKIWSSFVKSQ